MVDVSQPKYLELISEKGQITKVWYRFFTQLRQRTGGGEDIVADGFQSGDVKTHAGTSIQSGWLLCDGSAISRIEFSALFTAIGTVWGVGDGSTTFNIPDCRGRMPVGAGQGASLTLRAVGDTGGEETHQLTIAELAAHPHSTTEVAHAHANSTGSFVNDAAGTEYLNTGGDKGTTNANTATASTGLSVDAAGGDTAHENMSPFFVPNWIIKT